MFGITEIWNLLVIIFVPLILILNFAAALTMIFVEKRNPTSLIAWLMIMCFIPVLGFILYLFFGQTFYRDRMFRIKQEDDKRISNLIENQKKELTNIELIDKSGNRESYRRMILMLMNSDNSPITINNQVRLFFDGNEKFTALLDAINSATEFIHLEYYILKDDEIGNEIFNALTKKVKEGVEVRFLGDALGCAGPKKEFYRQYLEAGGKLAFFFPSLINFVRPHINYRNHRKIAVIDGKIGFVGGFNIGDDYLSRVEEWAPWRDSAVEVKGYAVNSMHLRFILDWNYAQNEETLGYSKKFFPKFEYTKGTAIQVVSGGPDTYWNQIKESYLKLIFNATESVYLQTPYFIPDESVMDALRLSALSGVDVRIMIPSKPDHLFVYWAGYSYIGQLLDAGVKAYTYDNGFIHAKTIVVDEQAGSIGSANWDVRSFHLNFETNVIMYDKEIAKQMKAAFLDDIKVCTQMTVERYNSLPKIIKIKESISRIFSPLL